MGSFLPDNSAKVLPPGTDPPEGRGGWTLALLLAATFAIRAIHPTQPIVENYVGRQIPTAMVARNLERGSGFFRPELDTGPFPNLFLVEPPIYAWVVATVRSVPGFDWEPTGRLVSAAATTLGAWGLYGLALRREGRQVALLALGSFGIFPVMIRYGRAFQPDALMLGFVLAGLRGWDEFEATGRKGWAVVGGFVLAGGLAIKITSAWVLIPFVLIVRRWPISRRLAMSGAMMVPALAWYLHAWGEVARPSAGSLASSDNAAIWVRTLDPTSWLRWGTWSNIGWALVVRSFTPVGFVLAALGLMSRPRPDRLWVGWAAGCALAILGLASKWHHAYYWMVVAPVAAVGVARGLVVMWDVEFLVGQGSPCRVTDLGRASPALREGLARKMVRWGAVALGSFFLAFCAVQSASTFRTPEQWAGATEAARDVQEFVPADASLIAPEALLYLADRRGYRLEFDRSAIRRAAGELGETLPDLGSPLALVELYRTKGGPAARAEANLPSDRDPSSGEGPPRYAADVGFVRENSPRAIWRRAIRSRARTTILIDRPDLLVAELR